MNKSAAPLFLFLFLVFTICSAQSQVVINELMADNDTTVADSAGDFDDWVELYNSGTSTVDLSGFFLTDKADNLDKWELPDGTLLEADKYLIIWTDEDSSQGIYHANFKLSAAGETIWLLDPDTTIIDSISWGQQQPDRAYARTPNGTGNFIEKTPTFAANNDGITRLETEIDPAVAIKIYPNPASQWIHIDIPTWRQGETITVFNGLGQPVEIQIGGTHVNIDVSSWISGIYSIRYQDQVRTLLIIH